MVYFFSLFFFTKLRCYAIRNIAIFWLSGMALPVSVGSL